MENSIEKCISHFQYLTSIIEKFDFENSIVRIKNDCKRNIDMNYDDIAIKRKADALYGEISLSLFVCLYENDEKVVSINYKTKGLFKSTDADNEAEFKELLKINGLAVLYSLARAHITTLSSVAGIDNINIPMINVYEYIKQKKDN